MKNPTKAWFALGLIVLMVLGYVTWNGAFANSEREKDPAPSFAHPVPGAPTPKYKSYSLPWNRREKAIITNGPGEGDHITNYGCAEGTECYIGSQEAIDFGARPPGQWNELRASKKGGVYLNAPETQYFRTWGNLLIISHQDNFFTYYAYLEQQSPHVNGTFLTRGSFIGWMGNTGCRNATPARMRHSPAFRSTRPHVESESLYWRF
ncbi:MAG: M23 family metallopeptidase [Chloroflexi bacterium]|nr:M23 family metallopeptidase [Chloroflexota bacterium]